MWECFVNQESVSQSQIYIIMVIFYLSSLVGVILYSMFSFLGILGYLPAATREADEP